jgi:hypothetical protein
MNTRRLVAGSLALPLLATVALAQAPPPLPALDTKPVPRVDPRGPSAAVTALAFADGETLYAAGLDKVVRVWTRQGGRFVLKTAYRVPVGPGNAGAVNAVALSPDGAWVAMAGRAPMRGEVGFRQSGVIVESAALSAEQNRDVGVIYVARTANPAGGKVLRGHRGEVRALAFAPAQKGKPPLLVSAATERDGSRRFGGLCLWDAAAGGPPLAERTDLPARDVRPGLAVWHTGPGATQVRAAVAWREEGNAKESYLRLWSPETGSLRAWEADAYTQTAALVGHDDGASVLAGGVGPAGGRLGLWHFSADRKAEVGFGARAAFPPRDGVHFRPVGLAVVPVAEGAAPRYAAVVLQPSPDADFRLALIDLRSNGVVADLPLPDSDRLWPPVVAAGVRHVAVAATRDHAVRVYALADLLEGQARPEAVLAADALAPRRVAFVDKGRGLWLSEDERAASLSGGLLFDLDKRQVRANDGAAPAADVPDMGEWTFAIDEDRKGVSVRQGDKDLPPLRLRGKDEVVTTAALRPPAAGRPGLLAVAYTERDASRTLVALCDPADGKPFRLLAGHLQDVRALAFAASRPLLASVAEDQTVCVWGLADLDRAVGQVPGLHVDDEAKQVVVRRVEPGSPATKAGLAEGDVLEKLGEAKPVESAAGFQLAVSARRPGDQVAVTVRGKGVVKLPVGRGVDGRGPLFSLLLLRTGRLPAWVGWSPAGPYDSSGPGAEEHLGWHTNTNDPAAPVSYAAAGEYRKDYYREGLLGYLAAEADLGRALQKWDAAHPARPPRPALRPLRPDGALPGERADKYLVRRPVAALRVGINADYALDDHHVLRWRLARADGGKVTADAAEASGQAPRDGKEWRADLAGVDWRRGDYRLRVGLHARADGPELASEAVTFRFQPPAPAVVLRVGGRDVATTEREPLRVMEDKLTLEIDLKAPAGQDVEVRFAQSRNGLPQEGAPAARVQTGGGSFSQEFRLQEGLNHLMVRAVNKGALAGHEDDEAGDAEVWVSYKAPRELPPRFTTLRLEPEPEVRHRDGREVWVVSRPAVRLVGKVEAEGVLMQADWSAGGEPKSVLPPAGGRTAEFAADLELKAGEEVSVRLRARSTHSDESTVLRRLVFHPPLPVVAIDPLDSPDVLAAKVALKGTVRAATKDPIRLRFRVTSAEGKEEWFLPEVEREHGTWKVELTLFPGENSIQAFAGNEWRGERAVERLLKLRYRRPPRITKFPEEVEAVETNKVKLAMTVEGPAGRPLTAVQVDQRPVRFEAGRPETQGDRSVWTVELPEVFVNDGDRNLNSVSVRAVSDEGASPAAVVRVVHKMIPRPPRARFLSPAAADTARRPEYTATFRVESERPLEGVEVRRGDAVLYRADLNKVEREGPLYVLQAEAPVALKNGANTLELVAVNADGRSPRAEVVVSYTEPAVLIDLDRVEVMADAGEEPQVLKPASQPDSSVTFPRAPRSLVWLVGRVRWSDPQARALDDPGLEVVVRVGDCRQLPAALGPRGTGDEANVRRFRVPLVLIGSENRIQVEVPSVGQQQGSRRDFDLACAAPARSQRLHVLIVGVDVTDATELKKRVLDALGVAAEDRPRGPQGEFFKKPPFERCVLYHVLAGEVDRSMVEGRLLEINREIVRLKGETGWLNDLVLIYYQGEDVEVPEKRQRWLKTSLNIQFPTTPVEQFAVPCHDLPRLPGSQLLLLNVSGAPGARVAGAEPGTGFMRYACDDPAAARNPDSALLGLLQEAVGKHGRLGEVAAYVNDRLGRQPLKISPLVVLDPDQRSRRVGATDR